MVVIILQYKVYQIYMYNLNLPNVICQLYLNKAGQKKQKKKLWRYMVEIDTRQCECT